MRPPPPCHEVREGLRLHQAGRLREAHEVYAAVLDARPDDPHACHLMGVLMHQTGRHQQAVDWIGKATGSHPDWADPWNNLGLALRALGRDAEAENAFRRALKLEPALDGAWNNLGNVLQDRGEWKQAIDAYESALSHNPGFADAHYNRARLLARLGRPREALEACRLAIESGARQAELYGLAADSQLNLGRAGEALRLVQAGLERAPEHSELLYTLGFAHSAQGELSEARDAFARALGSSPDHAGALAALLYVKRQLADWEGTDRLRARFIDAVEREQPGLTPFSFLAEPSTPTQQLACARLWTRTLVENLPAIDVRPTGNEIAEPMTIAYLSADYYRHPTAYLVAGMFERHDRQRFRVLAYSNGRDDGSAIRRRIEQACDDFVDIREMSAADAARRIAADGADILVDLKGHTLDAATAVTALRPAPIQVQYLGYPGTMGADFIDYVIGDAFVTPMVDQPFFDEHIVQLPDSYQINDDHRPCPDDAPPRAALGLPEDGTVLCCFNATWKINQEVFTAWMRILRRAPDSVLWLLLRPGADEAFDNLQRQARHHGVGPDRLIAAESRPLEAYLQLYRRADLFLDTLPYNAHTTASDSLWMACPVLTVLGDTFASRVGSSLAHATGTTELVCRDLDEFVQRGAELAGDPERLAALRTRLDAQRNALPLFDTGATTRHIECAYREMRRRLQTGETGPFRVCPKATQDG